MGGGLFSMFTWPWQGSQGAPDPLAQQLEEKQKEFEAQKKVLDSTVEALGQSDQDMAEQQALIETAKQEKRFIALTGTGQFVVNSLSDAISDWGHNTTGETNAELLKDMRRRLQAQQRLIIDAQQKMDTLSRRHGVLQTWKDLDEARMRRLANEVTSMKALVKS